MKPGVVFCECPRTRPYNPCIGAQMATVDTTKKVTTTSEKTGVATVATMALAALLDDQPSDLQKSREAYKRASARRRERRAS